MKENYRTCAVCRDSYQFCPRCKKDTEKPLWFFSFCSENCKNIYDITSQFENNKLNTDEAKEQLNRLDLSKRDNFGESYKISIDKIYKSIYETVEVIDEVLDEEKTEHDIEEIEEEKVLKKSRNKRAKIDVEE